MIAGSRLKTMIAPTIARTIVEAYSFTLWLTLQQLFCDQIPFDTTQTMIQHDRDGICGWDNGFKNGKMQGAIVNHDALPRRWGAVFNRTGNHAIQGG